MSFKWNVQPYQFKKDLVNEYANAVIVTTRKVAMKEAAEMSAWMKENAPWTDRTEAERAEQIKRKRLAPSGVPAREGLYAYVDDFSDKEHQEERKAYIQQQELAADNEREARLLAALEAKKAKISRGYEPDLGKALESWREKGLDINQEMGMRETQASAIRNLSKVTLTLGERNKIKRPRVDKSGLKDIDAKWKGQRLPVVAIKAGYNKNTAYAVWLEIANGGRYSILDQAIHKYADRLFNKVNSIVNLKQFRDKILISENALSPQERFSEHVAAYEKRTGREYEPWSSTRIARREERRMEWDREQGYYGMDTRRVTRQKVGKSLRLTKRR